MPFGQIRKPAPTARSSMVSSAPSRAEDIEKWQLFRCASGDMTAKKKVTGCDTVFHWHVTRPYTRVLRTGGCARYSAAGSFRLTTSHNGLWAGHALTWHSREQYHAFLHFEHRFVAISPHSTHALSAAALASAAAFARAASAADCTRTEARSHTPKSK